MHISLSHIVTMFSALIGIYKHNVHTGRSQLFTTVFLFSCIVSHLWHGVTGCSLSKPLLDQRYIQQIKDSDSIQLDSMMSQMCLLKMKTGRSLECFIAHVIYLLAESGTICDASLHNATFHGFSFEDS